MSTTLLADHNLPGQEQLWPDEARAAGEGAEDETELDQQRDDLLDVEDDDFDDFDSDDFDEDEDEDDE